MRPGKLVYVVTVQRWNAGAVNDFGTEAGAWAHLATMRAEPVTLSTEEAMAARGATDEGVLIIKVRELVKITTADRLVFRSKAHSIREVRELPEERALELHCVTFKKAT